MSILRYAEFYITNHCNIDCESCNRFNNYNFKGHMDWQPYEDEYRRWAEYLQIRRITILGGEPLIHPDVNSWIKKIREWWPLADLNVTTNGRLLNQVPNLYNTLKETKCKIEICIHNYDWVESQVRDLGNFFPGDYDLIEVADDSCFFTKIAQDKNGVKVIIKKYNSMHQSSLIFSGHSFKLHKSNPEKAHQVCDMSNCHHFINGKIYKCGIPYLLGDFSKQYMIDIDQDDINILNHPGGFSLQDAKQDAKSFWSYLENPIDHCKFCPETYDYRDISSTIGKTKIPIHLKRS